MQARLLFPCRASLWLLPSTLARCAIHTGTPREQLIAKAIVWELSSVILKGMCPLEIIEKRTGHFWRMTFFEELHKTHLLQKCVGDFCRINFGGSCGAFSWRIVLGTCFHRNEDPVLPKTDPKHFLKINRFMVLATGGQCPVFDLFLGEEPFSTHW